MQGILDAKLASDESRLTEPLGSETMLLPERRMDIDLTPYSSVLSNPGPVCYPNAPLDFQVHPLAAVLTLAFLLWSSAFEALSTGLLHFFKVTCMSVCLQSMVVMQGHFYMDCQC